MSPMAELTTEKKYMQISKKSKDMQHNGQRKRRTCNTTQWPKETKDMQHNTMAKGKEKQQSIKHYIENYRSRSTKVTKNGSGLNTGALKGGTASPLFTCSNHKLLYIPIMITLMEGCC